MKFLKKWANISIFAGTKHLSLHSSQFIELLYQWHAAIERHLPWKVDANPYKIWISEIILQQTRVEQGTPYYLRFIERFPDVQSLAAAEEQEVLKLWEGLGYYSRARNLHAAAKQIVGDFGGEIPTEHQLILSLKGIGPYTAAAIASFAFGGVHAVVDGNVIRVLSRIFGITEAVDTTMGIKQVNQLASQLIDQQAPGRYNQAIMDFGALQCLPKNPLCQACPFELSCHAYRNDLVDQLPFKVKTLTKKSRYFHYFILENEGSVLLQRREKQDIWQGLFEFPLLESNGPDLDTSTIHHFLKGEFGVDTANGAAYTKKDLKKHLLTHREIHAFVYKFEEKFELNSKSGTYFFVPNENLGNFAFPKLLHSIVRELIHIQQ